MTTTKQKSIQALALVLGLLFSCVAYADLSVHEAAGSGTVGFNSSLNQIAFTAQGVAGRTAKGEAEFHLRDQRLDVHVDVERLSVSGNQAWIWGVITQSNEPSRVGTRVSWEVVDNGDGYAPDRVRIPLEFTNASCSSRPALALVDLTNGFVQVR